MPQGGNSADKIIPGATRLTFPRQDRAESFCFMASATRRRRSHFLRTSFTLLVSVFAFHYCRVTAVVEDFVVSRRNQWLEFARLELADFKKRYAVVSVAGLSMGAALSAILAAENPDLRALVLIAPYFGMRLNYRAASISHWIWGPIAGTLKSNSPNSIHDPVEREKNLGYGVYTGAPAV
jgi:pimeloyl-ACP methyl ester carboxylesterase